MLILPPEPRAVAQCSVHAVVLYVTYLLVFLQATIGKMHLHIVRCGREMHLFLLYIWTDSQIMKQVGSFEMLILTSNLTSFLLSALAVFITNSSFSGDIRHTSIWIIVLIWTATRREDTCKQAFFGRFDQNSTDKKLKRTQVFGIFRQKLNDFRKLNQFATIFTP